MTDCCQPDKVQTQALEIEELIRHKREELIALLKSSQKKEVPDYQFFGHEGNKIELSKLFGNKEDLIVIHNMGQRCPSCTMWADGFNGVIDHLQDRAAFVLISNDDVDTQKKFKAARGWKFPMVSSKDTPFFDDMGFALPADSPESKQWGKFAPGISTFKKEANGKLTRVASRGFGPGDDFCSAWHMFDLLGSGTDGWEPKFRYG